MGSSISYLNELDVKATTHETRVQIACAQAIIEAIREESEWHDLYQNEQDGREKANAERDAALASEARARGEAERMAALATEQRDILTEWAGDHCGCDTATCTETCLPARTRAVLSRWLPAAPAPKEPSDV